MRKKERESLAATPLSRRDLLLRGGGLGLWSLFDHPRLFSLVDAVESKPTNPQAAPVTNSLSPGDDQFLDELEKLNFQYFWEQASPQTGLIKDRCNVLVNNNSNVGSIAATGFGLTALCIGQKRGFIPLAEARDRVRMTLRWLLNSMPNHRGFFYHWANIKTGERIWDSEISSIDTAILLCGVLTCRRHFRSTEIT